MENQSWNFGHFEESPNPSPNPNQCSGFLTVRLFITIPHNSGVSHPTLLLLSHCQIAQFFHNPPADDNRYQQMGNGLHLLKGTWPSLDCRLGRIRNVHLHGNDGLEWFLRFVHTPETIRIRPELSGRTAIYFNDNSFAIRDKFHFWAGVKSMGLHSPPE